MRPVPDRCHLKLICSHAAALRFWISFSSIKCGRFVLMRIRGTISSARRARGALSLPCLEPGARISFHPMKSALGFHVGLCDPNPGPWISPGPMKSDGCFSMRRRGWITSALVKSGPRGLPPWPRTSCISMWFKKSGLPALFLAGSAAQYGLCPSALRFAGGARGRGTFYAQGRPT